MEFYISPQSGQFYMINVLENQWLSVTFKVMKHYFMFVYMVYSLKMVSTKERRGLWLVDWYAYLR